MWTLWGQLSQKEQVIKHQTDSTYPTCPHINTNPFQLRFHPDRVHRQSLQWIKTNSYTPPKHTPQKKQASATNLILPINKQMKHIQEFLWNLTLTHLWQWQPPKLPCLLWRIGISADLNDCHPEHEMNRRRIFCFQEWRPPMPVVHCNICFICKGKKCPCSNKPFKCVSNIEVLSPKQGDQSTTTNTCSSCSFQNILHKSIRQHSKIAAAMIQQNCIADALCHQAISLFCRICLIIVQWLGPIDTTVHGMHYAVWLQQDCWTHMQLSLYTLILSVWVGLTICLHSVPKPNIARIALPPSPKATLPASKYTITHQENG